MGCWQLNWIVITRRVSTAEINTVLSQTLLQLLSPGASLSTTTDAASGAASTGTSKRKGPSSKPLNISSLLECVVPTPGLKFIDVRATGVRVTVAPRSTGRRPATSTAPAPASVAELLRSGEGDVAVDDEPSK